MTQTQLGHAILDPKDGKAMAEAVTRLLLVVDSDLDFGTAQDPSSDSSVVLAGTTHNGTPGNVFGSWVELTIGTGVLNTAVTCEHNLDVEVFDAGSPNVRWLPMGWKHNGTGADAASTVSCNFQEGDTVAANSIQLRFYAGGARTVNDANPLKVSLFFMRAVRWP